MPACLNSERGKLNFRILSRFGRSTEQCRSEIFRPLLRGEIDPRQIRVVIRPFSMESPLTTFRCEGAGYFSALDP